LEQVLEAVFVGRRHLLPQKNQPTKEQKKSNGEPQTKKRNLLLFQLYQSIAKYKTVPENI